MADAHEAISKRDASGAFRSRTRLIRSAAAFGRSAIWGLAGLLLLLAVWTSLAGWLGPRRLPSPLSLWPSIFTNLQTNKILEFQGGGSDGILPHLIYTIQKTLAGSALGAVAGILVGMAVARWRRLGLFLEVPLGALRSIPPLAAIPFMILWFGPSPTAQLGVVVFYATLMMTVTTSTAIGNLDPGIQQFALTLGASKNHVFRTVVLPSIVPQLVGGLRVLVGIAWGIEVVSELAGAQQGMGQVFSRMVAFNQLGVIIIGIIWIIVVAALVDAVIVFVSRWLTRWAPQNAAYH